MRNKQANLSFKKISVILTTIVLLIYPEGIFAQEEKPLSYYQIIEERNFFRPIEKTKEIKIPQQEIKKEKKSSYKFILTGIVEIKGQYKAIIEKPSGEGFYVGINESVEDYLVKDISADTVILQKDDKDIILKLKKSNSRDNTGSEVRNKEKIPQKGKNVPAKTGYEPNIIKRLRTGRSPAQR